MAKLAYAAVIERDQRYRALAELGLRFDLIDTPKLMPRLVELVAPEHLELLAESHSILGPDGYWLAESDSAKRRLIKSAYEVHRYKGTPWAIREIVRRLGFGAVEIKEGTASWAHYRVLMNYPITNRQAQLLRGTLKAFAPARCVLEALDFVAVPLLHNGEALRDGTFNKGTA